MKSPLLVVSDLHTTFETPRGPLPAVRGVSLSVAENQTVGIVGESGSGKTVLARTVMGLQPIRGVTLSGSVLLNGKEIVNRPHDELRHMWGSEVAMIFQDPMTSLNPVRRIGDQIAESLQVGIGIKRKEARARALELLVQVGIPSPEDRFDAYPSQLSGGMRQRVVIASALSCNPKLVLADEPTTGLDVTIQAQILDLLDKMKAERKMSTILVTHDLGVVATRTDHIYVMYAGRIVESLPTADLHAHHRHPYTAALLNSTPRIENKSHTRLTAIPGSPPNLLKPLTGCAFAARCSFATDVCRNQTPELRNDGGASEFACFNPVGVNA